MSLELMGTAAIEHLEDNNSGVVFRCDETDGLFCLASGRDVGVVRCRG